MSSVVFLRAANVGGRNVLRPAQIAKALTRLDVVNVGAAGTFVVRAPASATAIRKALTDVLPFVPVLAIRPAREITTLVRSEPFKNVRFSRDLRGRVGVLTDRPRQMPALPQHTPPGSAWHVRLDRVTGRFLLGLWRRQPGRLISPGPSLEAAFGVPLTVRYWETLVKVAAILES